MHKILLWKSCACGALGAVLSVSPVFAQSATTTDAAPTSPGSPQTTNPATNAPLIAGAPGGVATLAEVVVTAQKREENLQRTPVAVASLGSDLLDRSNVKDFSNIQVIAPDITINNVIGETNIAIRGVRESALGPTNDAPTAVHIDGVYLARSTGLTGAFFDIQRLEELKGPQGTLYGRNATGGVVNIITNKPTQTLGASVEAEGGNYGLYRFEAAVNVPVNDTIALRAAGRIYHHDGYYSNGLDDADEKGARLEALIHFTPKAKLLLTADYEVSDRLGPGLSLVGAVAKSPQPPTFIPGAAPNLPIPSNLFTANPVLYPYGIGPTKEFEEIYGYEAQFDYDLDFATLTAQIGNRRNRSDIIGVTPGTTVPPAPASRVGFSHAVNASDTTSAEVRLASNATRPVQWVGGLFYFTENGSGDMCNPGSFTSSFCTLDVGNPANLTISYAAFGQATYTPAILDSALHLTAGGRFNSDDKKASNYESFFGRVLSQNTNEKARFQATTYKVGAAYDLTARSLVYGNISTGFRAGGFAYGRTPEYKPETILAYEIGSKNRFFDNRLQINLDAFHYIYKNVETNVIQPAPPGSGAPFLDLSVQSIGKVHYTGASLEIEYALTPNDRIDADVEYLDAHYGKYVIPPQYVASPPINARGIPTGEPAGVASGLQVANTPPWTGTFAYDHTLRALSGKFDGRVAVQWSVERNFSISPPDSLQYQAGLAGGYARVDLSLRYAPDGARWNVTGYVDNVADARTLIGKFYEMGNGTPLQGTGVITANLLQPRTFGVIVGAKF